VSKIIIPNLDKPERIATQRRTVYHDLTPCLVVFVAKILSTYNN